MSNIHEVSKLAGVSKATVSRVINGNGNVGEQNRKRVLDAIATLNFRPSKVAQSLATNKTKAVAVVFPESNGSKWGVLLPIIATELQKHKMSLHLVCCQNDASSEYEAIIQLQGQCDAVLLYSRTLSDQHIQKLYKELTIPLLVMNRSSGTLAYPSVSIDQSHLVKVAMEHLIAKGHRHIACITGPTDNPSGQARLEGYTQALFEADLNFDPRLVATSNDQLSGGYQACRQLLELNANFTAIVCFNDLMAIGAQKALNEHDIAIPKQVSVIGIGNTDIGAHAVPGLTSVEEPITAMAKEATKRILAQCNKRHSDRSIILSGNLIERESTYSITPQIII